MTCNPTLPDYGIRRNLLEYDQVMNEQREIIYGERMKVLNGESMRSSIIKMTTDFVEKAVDLNISGEHNQEEWDYKSLNEMLLPVIPIEPVKSDASVKTIDELKHVLKERAIKLYESKEAEFPEAEQLRELERVILLRVIDARWRDHIDDMEQLKQGIGLQAYGQRDPKVEYKMAGYDMFDAMTEGIAEDTVRLLMNVRIEHKVEREENTEKLTTNREEETSVRGPVRRTDKKIYPNDPCPCGSGKKYKNCCGRK